MTPAEARALVQERLVKRKYLPALNGLQLKRMLREIDDNAWDVLAGHIKADASQAGWGLLRGWVSTRLAGGAETEVDKWIADKCIPPVRLVDLL